MTRAAIHTVVVSCPTCQRPHDQVVALVTRDGALSPELRFTSRKACLACGERLDTPQIEDDIRDTVSVLIWAAHHEDSAA